MDSPKLIVASSVFEFFGTLLYVFIGCAGTLTLDVENPRTTESIALCFGIAYAVHVNLMMPFSGGHLNPAVTVAMMMLKKISVARAMFYVGFQLLGGIGGAALLYCATPPEARYILGANRLGGNISPACGVAMEAGLTLIMVYTVLISRENSMTDTLSAVWSGMVVVVCHLAGLHFTSCSMNPARSLGPAVMSYTWENHWVFWAGPTVGSILAAFFIFFSKNFPSLTLDNNLSVRGEAIEMHEVATQHNEFDVEGVAMYKPEPASPSIARAAFVPDEMKTYL